MNNDTQVDTSACHAPSCPMLGVMSRSTNGGGEWLCHIHFASEKGEWYRITNELTRLRWIVDIVRVLRAGGTPTDHQMQKFALAQRGDLKQSASESDKAWMLRLEAVLQQSCRDSVVQL